MNKKNYFIQPLTNPAVLSVQDVLNTIRLQTAEVEQCWQSSLFQSIFLSKIFLFKMFVANKLHILSINSMILKCLFHT